MSQISVESARHYVSGAELPAVYRTRDEAPPATLDLAFDTAKAQAAVVGSGVISFVSGVSAERREAIVNSALLAQLVATKKVAEASQIHDWYKAYFEVQIREQIQAKLSAVARDYIRTLPDLS